mmetsp:Transcript_5017/g.15208  ORF Transcript_5017/g.15208 Transcript_5017/m.15208 type:complete len:775 (-) Transcript_5017:67-2391(-)
MESYSSDITLEEKKSYIIYQSLIASMCNSISLKSHFHAIFCDLGKSLRSGNLISSSVFAIHEVLAESQLMQPLERLTRRLIPFGDLCLWKDASTLPRKISKSKLQHSPPAQVTDQTQQELILCCWQCGVLKEFSCCPSSSLSKNFTIQLPSSASFFCHCCSEELVRCTVRRSVHLSSSWQQSHGCPSLCSSDIFVSFHGSSTSANSLALPTKFAVQGLNTLDADSEFDTLIQAISCLSQGFLFPNKSCWLTTLDALVNSATSFADLQTLAARYSSAVEDCCDKDTCIELAGNHPLAHEPCGPSEGKKHHETELVSTVIAAASDKLQRRYGAAPQIGLAADDDAKSANPSLSLGSDERETCKLCGGDYNYLASPLRPLFQQDWDSNTVANHEFCIETISDSLITCKPTQKRCSATQFPRGRTAPIAIDEVGRMYWRFASDPCSLHVQSPYRPIDDDAPSRRTSRAHHMWNSYNTLPDICQLLTYLASKPDCCSHALQQTILRLYPEAAAISECANPDDAKVLSVCIEMERALRGLTSRWNAHIDTTHLETTARHRRGEIVFVRQSGVLWPAQISSIHLCRQGRVIYQLHHELWNTAFDTWVRDENIVSVTGASIEASEYLYKSRMVFNAASCPAAIQHSTLTAASFVGASFRMASSPPDSLFVTESLGDIARVRAAILLVEAALPLGSKHGWTDKSFNTRAYRIEQAATPIELLELVLAIEDELEMNYVHHAQWISMRGCIPNRTYLLQNASCSWVALLLWMLDSVVMYERTETA